MASKRGFVKKGYGKRSPTRNASWVLKRIDSWQRFHSSIPIKYKVPIVLISGYVLTLIIALIFIGVILNLFIDQFEAELENKGFGGFAKLYTINKTTFEILLTRLAKIDLDPLASGQKEAIEQLPSKLANFSEDIKQSDQLYQNVISQLNTLSSQITTKSNPTNFADYSDALKKLAETIKATELSFSAIDQLLTNKTRMEELIFNLVLPVNSYQLQCGDQNTQQTNWNKFNSKWQLMKSGQAKYLYLAPLTNTTNVTTPTDIYDYITQLKITLSDSGPSHFQLSQQSLTQFSDGYQVKLKVKEKLPYAPPSMVCGLWLRTS
uniref:Uncharacterized protein n=1 Tax=Tetranychus urticae TaxID=32264 RepID=T1KKC2_TETUR